MSGTTIRGSEHHLLGLIREVRRVRGFVHLSGREGTPMPGERRC